MALKKDKTARYYYHVSQKRINEDSPVDNILFTPLGSDKCGGRGAYEPTDSRTCVTPTISQCFTALSNNVWSEEGRVWYIYRTRNKVQACFPYDVPDSHITDERWLVRPIRFKIIAALDLSRSRLKWPEPTDEAGSPDRKCLEAQLHYLQLMKNRLVKTNIDKMNIVEWVK